VSNGPASNCPVEQVSYQANILAQLSIPSKQKEKLTTLELSSDDWMILKSLSDAFEPFFHATNLLSGSKYPTIGFCLYIIHNIKEFLETEEEDQSNVSICLNKLLLDSLNHYFNENDKQYFLLMVSNFAWKLG
jgi:hypothetical protein